MDSRNKLWEISPVKTLKADPKQRVRIPDIKPGQVLAYENEGNGRFTLTIVKAATEEPFPPGSLKKYITAKRNRELLEIFKGCAQEPE